MSRSTTIAQMLAQELANRGVRHIFGLPGGGSSLDIIQCAIERGIEFILARTESAAVMMAAAAAEITGAPGVALTTKGPGLSNAMNGLAYASLDRSPVIFLTDGFNASERSYVSHQYFDQQAMVAPVVKAWSRLELDDVRAELNSLIEIAMTPPYGPVCIELTAEAVRRTHPEVVSVSERPKTNADTPDAVAMERASSLLISAKRPVIVAGLEARTLRAAAAVRALSAALGCPVLTTYKAKGVVADTDPLTVGCFTSGAAEEECVSQADVILLCGLDPVELLRQPWRYRVPVIEIAMRRHEVHYLQPEAQLFGDIAGSIASLHASGAGTKDWTRAEIAGLRERMRQTLEYQRVAGLGPQQVVVLAARVVNKMAVLPRITIDAGAHMFSVAAFWSCEAPCDVLISNGLATMAFALPAAIASAVVEPDRWTIAFTGDGGLLMCLGELSTAVEIGARLVVIVFNDASLSLIDIKQQQRNLPSCGVRWQRPDFAAAMSALGGRGYRASSEAEYRTALAAAFEGEGPALIDCRVDPSGYAQQLKALRG